MPKVHCKYCGRDTRLEVGDGIYKCEYCGAGLARFEDVEAHGTYTKYSRCLEARYGVFHEAIEHYRARGWSVDEDDNTASKDGRTVRIYPECPHEEIDLSKSARDRLYGLPLLNYLRRSVGLFPTIRTRTVSPSSP